MRARVLRGAIPLVVFSLFCSVEVLAESWTDIAPRIQSRPLLRAAAADARSTTRFVSLSPSATGIDLVNRLDWSHPQGLLFDTGYACGGVAVGDVDGNGLPDLFFVSALGRNRLYLQQSPWKFEDRTQQAGLAGGKQLPLGGDGWGTGATLFDIDNDRDLDLYVCNYDSPNQLYINRGDGTFDERAAAYGLDITDASLMPSVADYDRDGDLDIYLAVNRYLEEQKFRHRELFYWQDGVEYLRPDAEKYFAIRRHHSKALQLNMWSGRKDRLLRNEGPDKKFSDMSQRLDIQRGDTLSATWWDYDHDGWPDLYVANDLAAPDRLFHNNANGSFDDVALKSLPHTPWLAMGSSAGDINNDGLVDFLVADMAFRTHYKDKVFMGDMSAKFRNVGVFPHTQLMRNALFVNTGTANFQEAAYLADLASTDWTWTAKLADLDNDGRLDAYFTNGSPVNLAATREVELPETDLAVIDTTTLRKQYQSSPPVLEQNLVYQNQGGLQFADRSQAWGLDDIGMSFGAVHADLDRDGDLDLVVANLDKPPTVYRNDSEASRVLIELRGTSSNRYGIGAEVQVATEFRTQVQQVYPVSGFQACQEAIVHFGLAAATEIRTLTIRWPSGAQQKFENLPADKFYRITEPIGSQGSVSLSDGETVSDSTPIYTSLEGVIRAEHHEEPFDDFARQPLLPNKLSQLGPPLAWGDVDNDGDQDLFLGEGAEWMGMLYLNQGGEQLVPAPQAALARDAASEDTAVAFLDADGDGNLDLMVGSGSVEFERGDERLRDRLYFGDGKGGFVKAAHGWMPDLRNSTGAVAASDFDRDGDVDLFVGSRSVPGEYPTAPEHAMFRNEGDRFANVLAESAPDLAAAGMVTAALWADVDKDGWDDLLVATDWGPIRLYRNRQGKLVESTVEAGFSRWTGWWQSLASADVDGDGDLDLIAGNFGLNTKYEASTRSPVLVYYGQYGDSARRNLIEASYEDEVLFPMRGKSCSSAAMPHLATRFSTYEQFAKATLAEIYTPSCLQAAERFEVNTLASACFLNDGSGQFEMIPLPPEAQLAPVFSLAVTDANGDGIPDLFMGQNFFGPQRETGPMDGGLSVIALGQGDGTFEALRPDRAGVVVPEDTKAVAAVDLDGDGRQELLAATNDGPLRLFRHQDAVRPSTSLRLTEQPLAWVANSLSLAQQFFASDQAEQSLPYLRRALKVDPGQPEALLMLAMVRRSQGRFDEAKSLLSRVQTGEQVSKSTLLIEQGRLLFAMRRYDQAGEELMRALTGNPQSAQAHLYLGEVRLAQGRLEDARRHFLHAQRSDRITVANQQAEMAKLLYEQGLEAQSSGDDARAVSLFERSRRKDAQPRTLEALAQLLETTANAELQDRWYAGQLRQWHEAMTRRQSDSAR